VKITLWGTRGSLASPGPETVRYGGNTACVEIRGADGTLLVLDAGTGVRRLGAALPDDVTSIDILLTHLHMDHIQGLGFFAPLFRPDVAVRIWGPPSITQGLKDRLTRYLSPPLFPVRLRELPSQPTLLDAPRGRFEIGNFVIESNLVCHPGGPTVGYRISENGTTATYLPDHEPAIAGLREHGDWTSGFALAEGADVLIHDAQYGDDEYADRVGFGHSTVAQAFEFADATSVRRLVTFHHDPDHSDDDIDRLADEARAGATGSFELIPGTEGTSIDV